MVYKPELLGKETADKIVIETLFSKAVKMNSPARDLCYSQDVSEEARTKLWNKLKGDYACFDKQAGKHKFLAGEEVSIVDCYFYELLQVLKLIHQDKMLGEFKNLATFEKNFEGQEWFKAYKASDRWMEYNINAPMANINNPAPSK